MRSRRPANILILAFLTFQAIYPIRGLVQDKFETWGGFTWNMYSQKYSCTAPYVFVAADGTEHPVNYGQYFIRQDRIARVLHRDALPVFHRFLCERLRGEGLQGKLLARVTCTRNAAETEQLVDGTADICTAPDMGVVRGDE